MNKFLQKRNCAKLGLEFLDNLYRICDDDSAGVYYSVNTFYCHIRFVCDLFTLNISIEDSGICHTGSKRIVNGKPYYDNDHRDYECVFDDIDSVVNMISYDLKISN